MIDEQLLRVGGFTGYSAAGGVDCITLFDVKIQGLEWFTRIGFPGCLLIVLYGLGLWSLNIEIFRKFAPAERIRRGTFKRIVYLCVLFYFKYSVFSVT